MRGQFKQYSAIAKLTALEASRQPIFLLLTTASVLFIALLPFIITHVIGDSSRMVRDSALAIQFVTALILGCYAATATISRELKKGTLASIVSKPINRPVFFLAKFSGVALIMLIYTAMITLATMLSVRTAAVTFAYDWWGSGPLIAGVLLAYLWGGFQNYRTKVPFVSRAFWLLALAVLGAFILSAAMPEGSAPLGGNGHGHSHASLLPHLEESAIPWNIVPAGMLIGLAVILLCSMASSLSLKLQLIPTVSICFGIFIVGLMSDYLFGRRMDDGWIYAFLYGLVPNWQHFWAVDAIGRTGISPGYVLQAAGYAAVYTAVVLSAGVLVFNRMEVK